MSITTISKFYYNYSIDATNYQIDFDEGGSELTAELNFGDYSLTEFVTEVQRAMNAAGALTYTVSVARSTRYITISAGSNFSLLTTSGSHGANTFSLLGFSGADKTGASTYTGSSGAGSVFTPQFRLQSYVPPENYRSKRNVTIHETANSNIEVVYFGNLQMIEMDIRFSTNIEQPSSGPITNNSTGVADLNSFMNFLISKAKLEFMPDANDPDTYYTVILESTAQDKNGTEYKLKERTDISAPGYYDTGVLVFRVVT